MGEPIQTPVVAIIDLCRRTSKNCDKEEITFLYDNILVEYKGGSICEECDEELKEQPLVGIDDHGYFCASIIASRDFHVPRVENLIKRTWMNIPPPNVGIHMVGCPFCYGKTLENDIAQAIFDARDSKANVITMSRIQRDPSLFRDPNDPLIHQVDEAALDVSADGVLVVFSSGNHGEAGLGFIAKYPPWALTTASCTTEKRYTTKIEFATEAQHFFPVSLEGWSANMVTNKEDARVRKKGEIRNKDCVMHYTDSEIVVEESIDAIITNPGHLVHISKETSTKISRYLDTVATLGGSLYANFDSSVNINPRPPSVSLFSSRGPCSHFKQFMKPDICASGEDIVAAWLGDVPPEGGDGGKPFIARYAVRSGTSYSTPHIAAGLALIMARNSFSVSATISAAITTADRMPLEFGCEYAYGAGVFNLEKAMRPGLVYEEAPINFRRYFYEGEIPHSDLNLPYFSATFPSLTTEKWECHFPRRLKCVENGRCTYTGKVFVRGTNLAMSVESIVISVEPMKLVFHDAGAVQNFTLKVVLPHTKRNFPAFGIISAYLRWTKEPENEDDVKIEVDSPIILSSKDLKYQLVETLGTTRFKTSTQ